MLSADDTHMTHKDSDDSVPLMRKLVILSSGIPTALALSGAAPILPKMEAALAHDTGDQMLVKMVIGIVGIAMAVGAPLGGWLGDRLNRTLVISSAIVVASIMGATGYLISDLKLMAATRAVMGAAAVSALTVGFAMVGDLRTESQRNRYTGLVVSLATLSSVVVLPIAGYLGDIYWRLAFLLYLVPLPLGLLAYTELKKEKTNRSAEKESVPLGLKQISFSLPIGIMLIALFGSVIQYVPLTYVPFHLRNLSIESSTHIGIALTAESIVVAIASSFYGHIRAHVSRLATFALCFGLAGVGAIGIALAQDFISCVGSLLIIGVAIGWFSPHIVSCASETSTSSNRASRIGFVKGANLSSTFFAVLFAEPILRLAGVQGVFVAMAITAITASLVFGTVSRLKRPMPEAHAR